MCMTTNKRREGEKEVTNMVRNYHRKLWGEIITGNYEEKLSQEIITGVSKAKKREPSRPPPFLEGNGLRTAYIMWGNH